MAKSAKHKICVQKGCINPNFCYCHTPRKFVGFLYEHFKCDPQNQISTQDEAVVLKDTIDKYFKENRLKEVIDSD